MEIEEWMHELVFGWEFKTKYVDLYSSW